MGKKKGAGQFASPWHADNYGFEVGTYTGILKTFKHFLCMPNPQKALPWTLKHWKIDINCMCNLLVTQFPVNYRI